MMIGGTTIIQCSCARAHTSNNAKIHTERSTTKEINKCFDTLDRCREGRKMRTEGDDKTTDTHAHKACSSRGEQQDFRGKLDPKSANSFFGGGGVG